jgi:hypothetical protein
MCAFEQAMPRWKLIVMQLAHQISEMDKDGKRALQLKGTLL